MNAFMTHVDHTAVSARLTVGLAGLVVSQDPKVALCTLPLGACLGVAIYDPVVKVGGLLHSMLPASSIDPARAASCPAMFLDTGLRALYSRLQQLNATRQNLRVVVAGAAQMLDEHPELNLGKINSDLLSQCLAELGLEIHAKEVGGRTNCSMELAVATGEVRLKYSGQANVRTLCKL